ncbi:MAG: hypothetical protein ACYTGG_04815, partial [Planctomycetota bacterium]
GESGFERRRQPADPKTDGGVQVEAPGVSVETSFRDVGTERGRSPGTMFGSAATGRCGLDLTFLSLCGQRFRRVRTVSSVSFSSIHHLYRRSEP